MSLNLYHDLLKISNLFLMRRILLISFYINDICLMENGLPISFHKEAIVSIMSRAEISLKLKLGLGEFSATAWGCELSEEYVTFNSAYTT